MRITLQLLRVLYAFLSSKSSLCGVEISDLTELGPGTVYPLLHRLLARGWIEIAEGAEEVASGNRPRIHYALTPSGRTQAIDAMTSWQLPQPSARWGVAT